MGVFPFNTAVVLIMCQGLKTIVIYQLGKQKLDVILLARFCGIGLLFLSCLFVMMEKYTFYFVTLSKIRKIELG